MLLFRTGYAQGVRQTAAHLNIVEETVVKWTISVAESVIERVHERYVQWPGP